MQSKNNECRVYNNIDTFKLSCRLKNTKKISKMNNEYARLFG